MLLATGIGLQNYAGGIANWCGNVVLVAMYACLDCMLSHCVQEAAMEWLYGCWAALFHHPLNNSLCWMSFGVPGTSDDMCAVLMCLTMFYDVQCTLMQRGFVHALCRLTNCGMFTVFHC